MEVLFEKEIQQKCLNQVIVIEAPIPIYYGRVWLLLLYYS